MYSQDIVEFRKELLNDINLKTDKQRAIEISADTLYSLGLTMYSKNNTLQSLFYNAIAKSKLDENISLHPEQLELINLLSSSEGVIFSAPTSFGKTFVIFEYIAKNKPQTVVLVVPTLALVDEYKNKIIKKYNKAFKEYKIHININQNKNYSSTDKNLFILTHDKTIENQSYNALPEIDFLVIDEVYKLSRDNNDDRNLILNFAYYNLVQKSKKHLLLAPFISDITNRDLLSKKPVFYSSNFSPVVNKVITRNISIDNQSARFIETRKILKEQIKDDEKTLIYFSNVSDMPKFIESLDDLGVFDYTEDAIAESFLNWAKSDIHPDWYVVKSMENGFLVHNGDLHLGIRNIQLDLFENSNVYHKMLCTSTLLEGVNTTAESIIITKPSRGHGNNFDNGFEAFDFFNLVGRSGRLNKHLLGKAYYIKSPNDPEYKENDAIKKIEFEITSDSIDVQIQTNTCDNSKFVCFLNELNITQDEYKQEVGLIRFSTVQNLFEKYKANKNKLINTINKIIENPQSLSRAAVLYELLLIMKDDNPVFANNRANIINHCINKTRLTIKDIVEKIKNDRFYNGNINRAISDVIKIKNSYVEYDFYKYTNLITFFMRKQDVEFKIIQYINEKILNSIEFIYYKDDNLKKTIKDLGIYERDIETISKYVNAEFNDVQEIINEIKLQYKKFESAISYISKYVILKM